jgi:hypothetical protein
MNKMKEHTMITVAALAFMLITGVAKADGTDKITEIGQKVSTHISNEMRRPSHTRPSHGPTPRSSGRAC